MYQCLLHMRQGIQQKAHLEPVEVCIKMYLVSEQQEKRQDIISYLGWLYGASFDKHPIPVCLPALAGGCAGA